MTRTIEDYLSDNEKHEIALAAFREICLEKFRSDSERIFSNAAYAAVMKAIDESFGGEAVERIKNKALEVIDDLSVHTVFKRKDAWEKGDSEAYKSLNDAIIASQPHIQRKVEAVIDSITEDNLRLNLSDCMEDLLDRKLFGQKTT